MTAGSPPAASGGAAVACTETACLRKLSSLPRKLELTCRPLELSRPMIISTLCCTARLAVSTGAAAAQERGGVQPDRRTGRGRQRGLPHLDVKLQLRLLHDLAGVQALHMDFILAHMQHVGGRPLLAAVTLAVAAVLILLQREHDAVQLILLRRAAVQRVQHKPAARWSVSRQAVRAVRHALHRRPGATGPGMRPREVPMHERSGQWPPSNRTRRCAPERVWASRLPACPIRSPRCRSAGAQQGGLRPMQRPTCWSRWGTARLAAGSSRQTGPPAAQAPPPPPRTAAPGGPGHAAAAGPAWPAGSSWPRRHRPAAS